MSPENKKRLTPGAIVTRHLGWLLLAALVILFLILVYPSLLITQEQYQLGDIAMQDVKAPGDFFVEDKVATAANQEQAAAGILTVYDHDPRIAPRIAEQVRTVFARMRTRIEEAGLVGEGAQDTPPDRQALERAMAPHKESFETAMGIEVSRGAYRLLTAEMFSAAIAEIIVQIVDAIMSNGVVANKEVLLQEIDKGITLRDVATQNENTAYALRQYYGPDQAKTMVRIIAEPMVKDLNYNLINLIVDFSQRLLAPNITLNRNETEARKQQARESVKPIMYRIKTGEMVLREGERVTAVQLLKLRAMEEQSKGRPIFTSAVGAAAMLAIILIVLHFIHLQLPDHKHLNTSKNLLFMTLSLVLVLALTKAGIVVAGGQSGAHPFAPPADAVLVAIPIAACAMLVCLVLGFEIALPFGMVAAMCAALLMGTRLDTFLFFAVTNSMAAFWVQHCRERRVVIMAGIKTGILGALMALAIGIHAGEIGGLNLAWMAVLALAGGLLSGIITLGVAPLVEMGFGFTTDITLLELANLDRPILRRLMIEAPGTYHHSVIVGSLVEAAASEINANPLLGKVCGYYHDIGKVKKPLYFIENQTDGRNKHDKLAPSMSSLILIAHVKDGVEIARKQKLGQVIIDTIQQHHGTSLIHYFFEKAKQLKGEDAVKIDDYRYPGPKPQTKEVGLVMLADIVEAASRTLENPTPARLQGLVQQLINKVFSDGQLDNCELTLKDLHSIAKSFNKILNGIHHHRIEYTESSSKEGAKTKNGHSDRQSTGKPSHRDAGRAKERPSHLKRLGMS
ncbi:HD family phosphohydrolase [Desulfatitalea alkaliphila]|uniref:HDIG domain-containing protein n=1 Tax=Desulfatitalea alkaliphila TaxID=2929485 RepID=A0AA41R7Z1_9BACT|nr:HDIG domain-containing metalloprotein [Desulfatitalea alkaliphila]MCJ8500648.1 HDIG domain-containing protein [Desulfatitalea alkaliphila]